MDTSKSVNTKLVNNEPVDKESTKEPGEQPATAPDDAPLSFWQMLASTLWAALGVQNNKNRERDFSRGKASHFIYFGIGFTVFFVLAVYAVVKLVLGSET